VVEAGAADRDEVAEPDRVRRELSAFDGGRGAAVSFIAMYHLSVRYRQRR
jgi:hypothetical protein